MKKTLLAFSLLLSVGAMASNCGSEANLKNLCLKDAVKLDRSKMGQPRLDTYASEIAFTSSGHYPAPYECVFSYFSDVNFRGSHYLVPMSGKATYEPVTCKLLSISSAVYH